MGTNYKESLFEAMPVVGIMRNYTEKQMEAIVPRFQQAGFTTLEVTMNSPNAQEVIRALTAQYPDLNIGAGTVCDTNDLEKALEAGASFIVTPIMDEEVMRICSTNNIPIFPGAFTPLEIYKAWKAGASAVKIFPATQLGPQYVKDVLAPLNRVKVLPTGGVSLDNIEAFFKAGATGLGMGSTLFDKQLVAELRYDDLLVHFQKVASLVRGVNI